jgi:hypothetical protein
MEESKLSIIYPAIEGRVYAEPALVEFTSNGAKNGAGFF